jgi:hypothetical protein
MTHKDELADIEWQYTTGAIDYEEYRRAIKGLWAKTTAPAQQQDCTLHFNPEPGIAVRTKLASGRGR